MRNIERKKLAVRSRDGRAHVYEAKVKREAIMKPALKELVRTAFGGSLGDTLELVLSVGKLTPDEKDQVTKSLKEHKTKAAPKKKAPKKVVTKKAAKEATKKAAKKTAKKAAKK